MKKFLLIMFSLIVITPHCALADDFGSGGDLWDNFGDQNEYGQKPVTDEEFEKVLEQKKKRYNIFGKEKRNKNIPKGEEFRQSKETEFLNEVETELPIVIVPVEVILSETEILPIGHYQIEGIKENSGEIYLKFYQAHSVVAKVKATETNDDFDQKTVNFANWIENGDDKIKFIYGSLDFNAYADLYINK